MAFFNRFGICAFHARRGAAGAVFLVAMGTLCIFFLGFMAGKRGTDTARDDARGSLLQKTGAILSQTAGDVFGERELGTGGKNQKEFLEIPLAVSSVSEAAVSSERDSSRKISPDESATIFPEPNEDSHAFAASVPPIILPTSEKVTVPVCAFVRVSNPTHDAIMNEIAWMGSARSPQVGSARSQPSQSSGGQASQVGPASAADEWIEIKNISGHDLDLAGWQMIDEKQNFKIVFSDEKILNAGSLMLLERTDDESVPGVSADLLYTGGLLNSGMLLQLLNRDCQVVDELDASRGWPGGDNATKQTLERNSSDFGWHTSAASLGTPRAENSAPAVRATGVTGGAHLVTVSNSGAGAGSVVSTPPGINCGLDCSENFSEGTAVTFTATPEPNSTFDGWIDSCSGKGACSITVTQAMKVGALFSGGPVSQAFQPPPTPTPAPPAGSASHLMIVEVQTESVAGKSEDYIKLVNPDSNPLAISSWKLRKRTQSGMESSIRVFPNGSSIAAGGYFLWANSSNGFSMTIGANVSSTVTIADNTSVALEDANGAVIDAVAWGSGHVNPLVEGSPYPENPAAPQTLRRIWQNGMFQDTDVNSVDFELQ